MMQAIPGLRYTLKSVAELFSKKNIVRRPFASRINARYNTFWKSPDAEMVKNAKMLSSDPLTKWKDVQHWQRKLSNKSNAKEFAKLHNCKVARLFWKGKNLDTLDFKGLPPYYVIRPTIGHSCNLVFLMANSVNLMNNKRYSPEEIKSVLSEALHKNAGLEFLFEEFVRTEIGEYLIPDDYKFYMFNGEIAVIEVINRLNARDGLLSCYDKDWNMVANTAIHKFVQANYQSPPCCLAEMIVQAKKLSKSYEIFVRIDFYATDQGAVFGEFTPTPGAAEYLTQDVESMFLRYWDNYCNLKI